MELDEAVSRAAGALESAEALLIGAGAGMSVDSGLPAFRLNPDGGTVADVLRSTPYMGPSSPSQLRHDPKAFWGSFGFRLGLYRRTRPHRGYEILKRWAERVTAGGFVVTSNIDGQFEAAGFAPEIILEGHGSVHHLQCSVPCTEAVWSADGVDIDVDETNLRATSELPRCPSCGELSRPNVFMFGDTRFNAARADGQLRAFEQWLSQTENRKLVAVECGAGTAVPTIRLRCQDLCRERGGTLIRINLREPEIPDGAISIQLGALDALEKIDDALSQRRDEGGQ